MTIDGVPKWGPVVFLLTNMKRMILISASVLVAFVISACDSAPSTTPPASKKITNDPSGNKPGTAIQRDESGDK